MSRSRFAPAAALAWGGLLLLVTLLTVALLGTGQGTVALEPAIRLWPPPGEATTDRRQSADPRPAETAEPLPPALAGWTVERGSGRVAVVDGVLRLEAPPADPYALLRRPLPFDPTVRAFRIRGEARFTGIGGAQPVAAARIHLQGRDAGGRLLPDRREDAFNARASGDWVAVDAVLAAPAGAAAVELLVRLQRAVGRLELRALEVAPLVAAPWRAPAHLALALAWLATLAAGALLLVRAATSLLWAAAALAGTAGGLVLLLAPPELLANLLPRPLVQALGRSESVPWFAHLLLAAALGLLATRAAGVRRALPALFLVPIAAVAGEAIQLLTFGREASLDDALANALGGCAGVALALRLAGGGPPERAAADEIPAAVETALPLVPLDVSETRRG